MGIDIYKLDTQARRQVIIGASVHQVGVICRLWKNTETGLSQDRIDTLEAIDDVQAARTAITPPVVMVDGHYNFGEQGEIRAFRLLGWDRGWVRTQDFDWDHLPVIGWAVDTSSGPLVMHEEVDGSLEPMSEKRARTLGILGPDGQLAEHSLPTIVECRSVKGLGGSHYAAECLLSNDQVHEVFGESESGELPGAEWFVGRDTAGAARYKLTDQVAGKPKSTD